MNWSSLKAHVIALARRSPFVGAWVIDRTKSRQRPETPFNRAALQFAVLDETVTITDVVEDVSGRITVGPGECWSRSSGRRSASGVWHRDGRNL